MTEWELQDHLTVQWINSPLQFQGTTYYLVAWELMFPSWEINNNKKKWNEVSVDFILFDGKETFLCLELKNEIKGKKALLSAYCQAMHRTHLFRNLYTPDKMLIAHQICFSKEDSYRIRNVTFNQRITPFPENPIVLPILAAMKFPVAAENMIAEWAQMSASDFADLIGRYKGVKEFRRIEEEGVRRVAVAVVGEV
jgi:hypothetical protein